MVGTAEFMRGLRHIAADPHASYQWVKLIDGDPRPGSSIIMAQRVLAFCDLATRQLFYEPLSGYDSVMLAQTLTWRIGEGAALRLDQRDHVAISFDIFESAYTAPRGHLELPRASERPKGIHAVEVAGWTDGGEAISFQNSWGTRWGDHGYGTVSREYLNRYLRDAWLHRNARYGFTRFDWDRLEAAQTPRQFAAVWLQENPRWRRWIRYRTHRLRFYMYETISLEDEAPVTVIELRTGEGIRLGWAMLFHKRDGTAVLKEFFVWPPFRRRGYGTLLEREAVAIARWWRSPRMQVYLHSADALVQNRGAGREFGLRAGYRWRWRRTTLPNLDAVGEKML